MTGTAIALWMFAWGLIVVGVAIDTVAQMQAHLIQRSYDGFLKKGNLRGRR